MKPNKTSLSKNAYIEKPDKQIKKIRPHMKKCWQ